jgi:putative ABC transport system substrate-binding protein
VTPSGPASVHRDLIIALAARYKLPAVYFEEYFAAAGGLMSYGPDFLDQYRCAAGYVDRILKGEKPATWIIMGKSSLASICWRAKGCEKICAVAE